MSGEDGMSEEMRTALSAYRDSQVPPAPQNAGNPNCLSSDGLGCAVQGGSPEVVALASAIMTQQSGLEMSQGVGRS